MQKNIVVFAGNQCLPEKEEFYYKLAFDTGFLLAKAGYQVATGGGPGLMREVTRGAQEAGGRTFGVCLHVEGRMHSEFLSERLDFENLNPRQEKLLSLGDGFIAVPGGIGTLYEISAVIALKRKQEIARNKPLVLLGDYFQPLEEFFKHMEREGFVSSNFSRLYSLVSHPDQAVEIIKQAGA